MRKLTTKVKNYLSDDTALSQEVSTIIGVVAVIIIAGMIVAFVYNTVKKQANNADSMLSQDMPESGHEFDNNNFFGGN